ncbi:ankyrin repeat domain-containing protein [Altererythrobacter aquiaggeris]|uniref:ankyrin repeat domain-containing protein n=1 Tax=Aestuarierythrobacter aquiaggeris TaxID=1898396 RepID=UPI0030197BA9
MFRAGRKLIVSGALIVVTLTAALPAAAQSFSDSYKFLKAVREKDGSIVSEMAAQPGSMIVNTRDATTLDTALHIVAERGDTVWVRYFLQKGARVDVRNKRGETPLILAVNGNHVESVRELIAAGANIDEGNVTGETPLIAAILRRDTVMIRALLEGGANPDRSDNSGRSARDYAMLDGARGIASTEIERFEASSTGEAEQPTYGPEF